MNEKDEFEEFEDWFVDFSKHTSNQHRSFVLWKYRTLKHSKLKSQILKDNPLSGLSDENLRIESILFVISLGIVIGSFLLLLHCRI